MVEERELKFLGRLTVLPAIEVIMSRTEKPAKSQAQATLMLE